jgi:hypothetical protein
MRVFLLAPCLLAVACGASSTLGGDEPGQGGSSSATPSGGGMGGRAMLATSAQQQLGTKLQTWCPEICQTLSQCPQGSCSCQGDVCSCVDVPDPATCPAECQSAVSEEFLGHGEACAELGLTYVDCLSAMACQILSGSSSACVPDGSVQATVCSPPPPAGGVNCGQGWGTGVSEPVTTPGALVCEQQWEACSDGHVYRVSCYYAGAGQLSCSCLVDGVAQRGFASSASCPPSQEVNAACGWQLASVGPP